MVEATILSPETKQERAAQIRETRIRSKLTDQVVEDALTKSYRLNVHTPKGYERIRQLAINYVTSQVDQPDYHKHRFQKEEPHLLVNIVTKNFDTSVDQIDEEELIKLASRVNSSGYRTMRNKNFSVDDIKQAMKTLVSTSPEQVMAYCKSIHDTYSETPSQAIGYLD